MFRFIKQEEKINYDEIFENVISSVIGYKFKNGEMNEPYFIDKENNSISSKIINLFFSTGLEKKEFVYMINKNPNDANFNVKTIVKKFSSIPYIEDKKILNLKKKYPNAKFNMKLNEGITFGSDTVIEVDFKDVNFYILFNQETSSVNQENNKNNIDTIISKPLNEISSSEKNINNFVIVFNDVNIADRHCIEYYSKLNIIPNDKTLGCYVVNIFDHNLLNMALGLSSSIGDPNINHNFFDSIMPYILVDGRNIYKNGNIFSEKSINFIDISSTIHYHPAVHNFLPKQIEQIYKSIEKMKNTKFKLDSEKTMEELKQEELETEIAFTENIFPPSHFLVDYFDKKHREFLSKTNNISNWEEIKDPDIFTKFMEAMIATNGLIIATFISNRSFDSNDVKKVVERFDIVQKTDIEKYTEYFKKYWSTRKSKAEEYIKIAKNDEKFNEKTEEEKLAIILKEIPDEEVIPGYSNLLFELDDDRLLNDEELVKKMTCQFNGLPSSYYEDHKRMIRKERRIPPIITQEQEEKFKILNERANKFKKEDESEEAKKAIEELNRYVETTVNHTVSQEEMKIYNSLPLEFNDKCFNCGEKFVGDYYILKLNDIWCFCGACMFRSKQHEEFTEPRQSDIVPEHTYLARIKSEIIFKCKSNITVDEYFRKYYKGEYRNQYLLAYQIYKMRPILFKELCDLSTSNDRRTDQDVYVAIENNDDINVVDIFEVDKINLYQEENKKMFEQTSFNLRKNYYATEEEELKKFIEKNSKDEKYIILKIRFGSFILDTLDNLTNYLMTDKNNTYESWLDGVEFIINIDLVGNCPDDDEDWEDYKNEEIIILEEELKKAKNENNFDKVKRIETRIKYVIDTFNLSQEIDDGDE